MSAYEIKGQTISLKAAASMAGKKYSAVKVTAEDTFDVCAAGEKTIGFLQNEVISGEAGQVMINGVTMAKAEAPIAAGAKVAAGAAGTVKTAVSTNTVNGTALAAATAAGDIIPVLIGFGGVI
jgi:hypothetical protein